MPRSFALRVIPVLVCLANVGQVLYYTPRMPGRMAVHFDARGAANGFAPPDGFAHFAIGIVIVLLLVFLVVGAAISHAPPSLINLPNKAYWMEPARRAETMDYITGSVHWIALLPQVLLFVAFRATFQANLAHPPILAAGPMLTWIVIFIGLSIILAVRMILHFSATP